MVHLVELLALILDSHNNTLRSGRTSPNDAEELESFLKMTFYETLIQSRCGPKSFLAE